MGLLFLNGFMHFLTSVRHWLGFVLLLVVCFFAIQKLAGYTFVRVHLSSSFATPFKVYWQTAADHGWTETNSVSVRVNARKERHILILPVPVASIDKLRVDPSEHADVETHLRSISLHHLYAETILFGGRDNKEFARFKPNEQTDVLALGHTLKLKSTGIDAGFEVDLPEIRIQPEPILRITQSIILALCLFMLVMRFPWMTEHLRWVPPSFLLVACCVMVMALVSNINTHPDEGTHIDNALYYAEHYIPPEVCAEDTRFTYSKYGVSRLDKREIAYYLAGRYLQVVDVIPAPNYLKLRFMNVSLLFVLVLLMWRQVAARFLFLPLLLTPQSWYLFAYFNSDALSLFVVCVTAYQVCIPQSILRRILSGERPPGLAIWVLGLSLLVAMQFWLKLNFMFYPILLAMLAASWWILNRRWPNMRFAAPAIMAMVIGTVLFLGWEVTRHAINDFELAERIHACQDETAELAYKPSTPLFETHPTILLRDKGVSLKQMLTEMDWAIRTFYTGLGAYGYTEFLNSNAHYQFVSGAIVLFFLYVVLTIVIRGDGMARLAVLSTMAAMAGITLAAIANNWLQSFQTQGRYLIVYLPLLGTLIALYKDKLSALWLSLLASIPFLLGLYSFLAIAMTEIPK